jgi:hypothetical protein
MIVQGGSTNPGDPVRRGLRALGLLTPLVLLIAVVGAGLLGPRPEPPAPLPSLRAEAAEATPAARTPVPALLAGPGPGFPTVVASLGVRTIPEAQADLVATPGGPIAVAGILVDLSAGEGCAAAKDDTRGALSPLCARRARLVPGPGAARGGPHLHVLVPPGVRLPPAFEDTVPDVPMPVVLVGRGPVAPCTPDARGCGETLTADLVAWADGRPFEPGPVFDAGLQVPPPGIAYRRLAAAESLATGRSGSVLVAAVVRPATVADIDPDAATAMAAARPAPGGLVWYVRSLETVYGPTTYPPGDYPARMRWVVLDETTGTPIAAGLVAGATGARRTDAGAGGTEGGPAAVPAFPASVAGLPVLDVAASLAGRATRAGAVVAVAGWLRAWSDPAACPSPIDGLPGGGCPRTGLLVGAPWSDAPGAATGASRPVVQVAIAPGIEIPDVAVGLAVDEKGPPPPVVAVGTYDEAGSLHLEAVAWVSGQVLAPGRQVAAGLAVAAGDPIAIGSARTRHALDGAGAILRMVLAPARALAAIDPEAAARVRTAGMAAGAPLWYLRGLDLATGAVRWAVVDPGTGRVLARDSAE